MTFVYYFAQTKICNFDFSIMKNDVLGFQIKMNDLLFTFI